MSAGSEPLLPVSAFVVRAPEVRAHRDAATIQAQATAQAAELAERAAVQCRNVVEAGRAEGLRSGMAQAASLAAEAAAAVEAFWVLRDAELQELAFAIAHRMLASLPQNEVLARLAAEAIDEHRHDVRLTLRVADADAGPLRAALAEADPQGRVAVEADTGAAPGSCTLVHPRGRTRLGLLDQFRAMMQAAA